jgi:hypothetical protein
MVNLVAFSPCNTHIYHKALKDVQKPGDLYLNIAPRSTIVGDAF